MTNKTSDLVKRVPNPTGKGGFQERPQDINRDGTWDPTMTFKFQYPYFQNMKMVDFKDWLTNNPDHTVIQEIAWNAVRKARVEHKYLSEVANRTEGMPKQSTDLTTNGKDIGITDEQLKRIIG